MLNSSTYASLYYTPVEAILGGALEVTLGAGMWTVSVEGVVGTGRGNEYCENDMVRDV